MDERERVKRIGSPEELLAFKEDARARCGRYDTGEGGRTVLLVGMATCGVAAGARAVMAALQSEIAKHSLEGVELVATGCLGMCYAEPLVEVREPGRPPIRYGNVNETRAKSIVVKHVMQGLLLDNAIVGREVPEDE